MKIIQPGYLIEDCIDGDLILQKLERAARVCYKSEDKITTESAKKFISKLMSLGHHSIIEHEKITVRFYIDRGISHELVRHRLCSFSQESTRYANYSKDRFGNEITVIDPSPWLTDTELVIWRQACEECEKAYFALLNAGAKPQMARSVLPNSLKTEIVTTANLREWRHILTLRTAFNAHPQIRQVMIPLLKEFRKLIPIIFDDVGVVEF